MMEASKRGYVSFPLELIGWWFGEERKLTEFEAFVRMLSRVNFKNNEVNMKGGGVGICRRGESIRSVERWSEEFRWETGETREFFGMLLEKGVLEHIEKPVNKHHIRIADYEWLTGKATNDAPAAQAGKRSLFDDFWEHYHETTGMKPTERVRTRAAWDRLSEEEQDRAIEGVEEYYDGLTQLKYCRKAATYLENRSFE
jgi:hypothetical protein